MHYEIFDSPAYRDLTTTERCLLHEFQRICYPLDRNGRLSISVKRAMELLGCSKVSAINAFQSLHSHGFLRLKRGAIWQERKAREWQLTFMPVGFREPTDDWKSWKIEEENSISRVENEYQSGT